MDFSIPNELTEDLERFKEFIKAHIDPQLAAWYQKKEIPRQLFRALGESGWYGLLSKNNHLSKGSALREAMLTETVAKLSPGVAVAILAHIDLGLVGLYLFGSEYLQKEFGVPAVEGKSLMCLGNTEGIAGSDAAGITMTVKKVDGGWLLNGAKAYVTNGNIADLGIVTAVSDPQAFRNQRLSMFLVDLNSKGVSRKKAQQAGLDPLRSHPPASQRRFHP